MTKEQAQAECARLRAEHPERRTHRWLPRRESGDEWSVVKVDLPPLEPSGTEIRADERPATADDPRPAVAQNLPGSRIGY